MMLDEEAFDAAVGPEEKCCFSGVNSACERGLVHRSGLVG
jgi:hypothetical protein